MIEEISLSMFLIDTCGTKCTGVNPVVQKNGSSLHGSSLHGSSFLYVRWVFEVCPLGFNEIYMGYFRFLGGRLVFICLTLGFYWVP